MRSIDIEPDGTTTALGLTSAHDEHSIVHQVLDGDRDAFRWLVDREAGAVVRACHRVLGDFAEAEDVAQESFVIAYRSLASWRGDGPFGAWLARIAVRLAVRRAAARRAVTWIRPTDDQATEPIAAVAAPAAGDPVVAALRGERDATVRAAVARLDDPYREVVALRFFADRSLGEIAAVTGRPLGTVKTHLYRGLMRLKIALDEGERR